MPRGFKKSPEETKLARFLDPRSFVSLPKMLKHCPNTVHSLLYGKDKGKWREQVWKKANGRCEKCGAYAPFDGVDGYCGEAHHIGHKPAERCDCVANGSWRCGRFVRDCHSGCHPKPQWTRKPA